MGANLSISSSQPPVLVSFRGKSSEALQSGDLPLWCALVLEFSDWDVRCRVSVLSRAWFRSTSSPLYFRFLCERLAVERGLYVPASPPYGESWKSLFLEMYKLRALWQAPSMDIDCAAAALRSAAQANSDFPERFKVSVFAKFRPHSTTRAASAAEGAEGAEEEVQEVTLPLHQRLAMIRMSHKTRGRKAALKILAEEGDWFRARWASETLSTSESDKENTLSHGNSGNNSNSGSGSGSNKENNENEKKAHKHSFFSAGESESETAKFMPRWRRAQMDEERGVTAIKSKGKDAEREKLVARVQTVDAGAARVVMLTPDAGLREFCFDGVLPPSASQRHTYEVSVRRLVVDALNGFNATAIVYGQTGSGKTFTMFGEPHGELRGIVPRACEELLNAMKLRRERDGIESTLCVSYVEVFGDSVSDLLRSGARCGQSKVAAQRYVLSGAAEHSVSNMHEIYAALRTGEEQKRRASTAMNDRSTRAHSLFILSLSQRRVNSAVTLKSRLFLADLGGSEQVKKSQVEAGATRTGLQEEFSLGFEMATHMREAVYINLGLLALKKCIESLNLRSRYVPFQDSKLTMLLSEGIAGNSKTSVIVCAHMDPRQAGETAASLRFGERCALVETSARNNATVLEGILRDLDERIAALEREILVKERWEVREEKREDQLAEEGTIEKALGGRETRTTAMVVGAEEERKQLAKLLEQRAQFTGSLSDDDLREMESNAESEKELSKKKKKVVGFGREFAEIYGIGDQYDAHADEQEENVRFQEATNLEALPLAVRMNKGKKSWALGERIVESAEVLEKQAQKLKRTKLAYSGISA